MIYGFKISRRGCEACYILEKHTNLCAESHLPAQSKESKHTHALDMFESAYNHYFAATSLGELRKLKMSRGAE